MLTSGLAWLPLHHSGVVPFRGLLSHMKGIEQRVWRKWSTEHGAPWSVALLGVSAGFAYNCGGSTGYPFQGPGVATICHGMEYNIVTIWHGNNVLSTRRILLIRIAMPRRKPYHVWLMDA